MSLNNNISNDMSMDNNPLKKIKIESKDQTNPSNTTSNLNNLSSYNNVSLNHYYQNNTNNYSLSSLPISTPIPTSSSSSSLSSSNSNSNSYQHVFPSTSTPFFATMQPTPEINSISYPVNYNTQSSSSSINSSVSSKNPSYNSANSSHSNTPLAAKSGLLSRNNSSNNLLEHSPEKLLSTSSSDQKSNSAYIYSVLQSLKREDFDLESDSSASTTSASSTPSSSSSAPSSTTPSINKKIEELISNIIFEIGLKNSSPKILIPLMPSSPSGLSTEHIKSHLQKYRKHKNRYQEDFYYLFHNHIKQSYEENLKKYNTFEKINDYLLKKINSTSSSSSSSDNKDEKDKNKDENSDSKDEAKKKLTQLMNLQKLLIDSSTLLTDWKTIVRDIADRGDRINREILTLLAEPDELDGI